MQQHKIPYSPDMNVIPLYDSAEINSISKQAAIDMMVKTLIHTVTSYPTLIKNAAMGTNIPAYI